MCAKMHAVAHNDNKTGSKEVVLKTRPSRPDTAKVVAMRTLRGLRCLAALFALAAGPVAYSQFSYEVYDGEWQILPDFASLSPVATGTSDVIALSVTGQTETFGLVFTGTVNVSAAASYDFQINSDDGSRLYIDGQLVVDNDGVHAPVTVGGSIFLNPGSYPLRVEFFERFGGQVLEVTYQGAEGTFVPIPPSGNLNSASAAQMGQWGPVIPWPHIAISAAKPAGRPRAHLVVDRDQCLSGQSGVYALGRVRSAEPVVPDHGQ